MTNCEHKNISPIKWVGRDLYAHCPGCDKNLVFKDCWVQEKGSIESQEGIETKEWTFTSTIAKE